jgi:hypothetical protein
MEQDWKDGNEDTTKLLIPFPTREPVLRDPETNFKLDRIFNQCTA